jgi:hypothetical protein
MLVWWLRLGRCSGSPRRARWGSGEQHDLTAGAAGLEVAVGVGRGGEGIAVADLGADDAVAQRGEHPAGHLLQEILGVVEKHRLDKFNRAEAQGSSGPSPSR